MHDAARHASGARAGQQHVRRVAVRLADVQNYGLVELVGQLELTVEDLLLHVAGREVVMVVQTDFAQRDHLVRSHPFANQPGMLVRPQRGVVRVYARGGIKKVVFACE